MAKITVITAIVNSWFSYSLTCNPINVSETIGQLCHYVCMPLISIT